MTDSMSLHGRVHGQPGTQPGSPAWGRLDGQLTTGLPGHVPEQHEPEMPRLHLPAPLLLGEADTIVRDLQGQSAIVEARRHLEVRRLSVLSDIVEGLAGDSVSGHESLPPHPRRVDADGDLHPDAGSAQRCGQLVNGGGEPGDLQLRGRKLAQQGAQLLHRLSGGVGGALRYPRRFGGCLAGAIAKAEGDRRQVLDHAIVQVAPDSPALRIGGLEGRPQQ
jgi:hypothetical protein